MKNIYDPRRFYTNVAIAVMAFLLAALALLAPSLSDTVRASTVSGCVALVIGIFRRSGIGGTPPADDEETPTEAPAPAAAPSSGASLLPVLCLAVLAFGACDYRLRLAVGDADALGGSNADYVRLTGQATTPAACATPYGCVFLDTVTGLPVLMDASTNKYTAGTAWRTRQSAGTPAGVATYDIWSDTAAGSFVWRGSSGNITIVDATGLMAPSSLKIASAPQTGATFFKVCTITSAAAATPVVCLAAADVPASLSARLAKWSAYVNGGTGWGTTASCVIEDTSGNDLVSIAVAALTSNTFVADHSANVTQAARYRLGTGGAADAGLQVSCDANGTGSDLVFVLSGSVQ